MRLILLIILLVLIFASQINTIVDIDLWWIFRTAEFTLRNLDVPRVDIFSYAAGNQAWMDHEWLSQIILYFTFTKFGWIGVNMLKAFIISLCFFIPIALIYAKHRKILFAVFFALFSALAFGYRSFARPEIFSYLMLAVFFYILEKEKRLYMLPFLQVLWVNLHGYFIFGPLLVFLFSIGRRLSGEKEKSKRLAAIFIYTGLACLANPYFLKGALYPISLLFNIFTVNKASMRVAELAMPVSSNFGSYVFLWVFTVLSGATFFVNIKKAKLEHVLIYAFSFALAYMFIRNIPIFVFLAMPLAAINLNEVGFTKDMPEKKYYPALIAAVCFLVYFFLSDGYYKFTGQFPLRKTGSEFSRLLMPFGACDFLKKNNIKGRIFATFDFGAYAAYMFYPERRVFIGPWSDSYQAIYKPYMRAEDYPETLPGLQKKYDFNISLIRHLFKDQEKLLRYLSGNAEWHLVYYDENSAVFLRDTPENMEPIRKYSIDFNKKKLDGPDMDIRIANFFQKIGELRLAEEIYLKLLAANPRHLEAGNNLAVIYINTGRLEDGVKLINKFLNHYPKSHELYANMKTAYLRMEDRRQDNEGSGRLFGK